MSKALNSIYRMFDYFTGRFEPEDREEYLDALSVCFSLQLPMMINARYKDNKDFFTPNFIVCCKCFCANLLF